MSGPSPPSRGCVARPSASARLTQDQLARTLARLQNEPPWLVVTGLDVSADQALADGQSHPMETSFEVAIPLRTARPR